MFKYIKMLNQLFEFKMSALAPNANIVLRRKLSILNQFIVNLHRLG